MKPERIQRRRPPVNPEPLHEQLGKLGDWEVDTTPNAISCHFPQPSFAASVAFLGKVAAAVEKNERMPSFFGDASGVTVRLGNAPHSGVTDADVALARTLNILA